MSPLRRGLREYLALRSRLGFVLKDVRWALNKFIRFLETEGASHITTKLALQWATQAVGVQPATWAWRLGTVRRFAAWFSALDPRTEVPPQGLLPYRYRRQRPYVYRDAEIERVVRTAARLHSPKGLRGRTYSALFGLLAVTGMRVGEAVSLDRDDVDLVEGVLSIRRAKSGKSRLVPVQSSTQIALRAYADARDRLLPHPATPAFFLLERGTRVTKCMAEWTFAQVSKRVGLRSPDVRWGKGPRLHDMRHRFAAKTLIEWYRGGLDVEREIPKLATYLGHASVNDTYWYIEAVPELLQLATERLEGRQTARRP
jgi:integrase